VKNFANLLHYFIASALLLLCIRSDIIYLILLPAIYFWLYKKELPRSPLNWALLAFLLTGILSAIFSENLPLSLHGLWHLVKNYALYLGVATLISTKERLFKFSRYFVAGLFIIAVVDAARYIVGLGDTWAINQRWGASLLSTQWNYASLIYGTGILLCPLAVGSALPCLRLILPAGLFASIFDIFFALKTRSVQAGLLLAGVFLLFTASRTRWRRSIWLLSSVIILAMLVILLLPSNPTKSRYTSSSIEGDPRFKGWAMTIEQIQQRPITGYGPSPKIYRKWWESLPEEKRAHGFKHAHNTFLEVAYEEGLVGLAAFLSIFLVVLLILLRAVRLEDEDTKFIALVLFALFILFGGFGMFGHLLAWRADKMFFMGLGLVSALHRIQGDGSKSLK